jgi:uncharacterized protein
MEAEMQGTDNRNRTRRTGPMQDDARTVKDVYEAFGRGDVPAIFGLFHPEAEVYQSPRLPWGGEFRGHEELGVFLSRLTGAIESEVETGRFIDDEDGHVVQIGHTRGTVQRDRRAVRGPRDARLDGGGREGDEVRVLRGHREDARGARARAGGSSSGHQADVVVLADGRPGQ